MDLLIEMPTGFSLNAVSHCDLKRAVHQLCAGCAKQSAQFVPVARRSSHGGTHFKKEIISVTAA